MWWRVWEFIFLAGRWLWKDFRIVGDLNNFFGGQQEKMYASSQIDIPDEDIPRLRLSMFRFILNMPGLVIRVLTYRPNRGERMINQLARKIYDLQKLDISKMSDDDIVKSLRKQISDLRDHLADVRHGAVYTIIGIAAVSALDKTCRKWFGDERDTFTNRLLAGAGDMDSAQAGQQLWRLAVKANEISEVKQFILEGNDWKETRENIGRTERGKEFLEFWNRFMDHHGHHCRGEIEGYNPRWCEMPDYILGLVRSYIGCIGKTNPIKLYKKRVERRIQLQESCRKRLRNPVKRWMFNYLLNQAQRGCVFRENAKSHFVRIIATWRRMLLELGERLYSKGVLCSLVDIFFLRFDEIRPVTQGQSNFDIKEIVSERKTQYEKFKTINPPKVIVGRFDAESFVPESEVSGDRFLSGLAVSAGVAAGKARVILRSDTNEHIQAGEILVAPFTDPGWTPYFIPAAGIIMDQGGLLSHGSIIARELGIPAVVNVGQATKIIKTGQKVRVDGNRGTVTIS